VLVDDASEEIAGARAIEVLERLRDRHLDVLRGDLIRGSVRIDRAKAIDHGIAASAAERQAIAFCGEFGENVCVHGVDHSSSAARHAPTVGHYARPMENEEITEAPSGSTTVEETVEEELLIEEISIDGMCGVY
jgi:mycofactocin precursor